jgi:Membrane domain of glycerophosphoryl diester phosphodiesterase
MNRAELRPLGVGEKIDLAIKICRSRYTTMLRIVAVVVIPCQVLSVIIRLSTVQTTPTPIGTQQKADWAAIAGTFVSEILVGLAAQLASAACLKSVSGAYLGGDASWRESLQFAWKRLGSLVWIAVLIYILSVLALVLLVLPGIYLWTAWIVAMPVLLLEGTRGRAALKRSRTLVKGRWWSTFGTYLLASILVGIATAVFSAIVLAISRTSSGDVDSRLLVAAAAGIVSGILTTPFLAAIVAVIYFDLRVRKEGLDLELLAQGVGIEPRFSGPEEPPWPELPSPETGAAP